MKPVAIFIFSSTNLTFFIIVSVFTFNFMNSFRKIIVKFDNDLAIYLALSINCNLYDIFFVISSPFLSIIVTSFPIGNVKVIYFQRFLLDK